MNARKIASLAAAVVRWTLGLLALLGGDGGLLAAEVVFDQADDAD